MKTAKVVVASICIVVLAVLFFGVISIISMRNTVVVFEQQVDKQISEMKAKRNEYLTKVKESAQVPEKQMNKMTSLYDKLIQGRKSDGAMMKWITESNLNINQDTFVEIQRIVQAGRAEIFSIQQRHIDTIREYNTYIIVFPNNVVNSIFLHRSSMTPTVPLSDEVHEVYKTKTDKVVDIFGK